MTTTATVLSTTETFQLIPVTGGFAIQTFVGTYLTATGGGGQTVDAIHADATIARSWETFRFTCNQTIVPSLHRLSTADAVSALSAAGLVEGSVTQSSFCTGPAGTVQQQMPGSGSVVVRGSAVNLTVNQPTCNR